MMLVLMDPRSTTEQVDHIVKLLSRAGLSSWVTESEGQRVVEVLPAECEIDRSVLEGAPMVDRVLEHGGPMLAANRPAAVPSGRPLTVPLGAQASVGGRKLGIIAGPCSVESRGQLLEIAAAVKEAGAVGLRGGAFKPRTSPYSFQGHGKPGLEMLARAREETGLAVVTEVMRCEDVALVAEYADVLQVGSRSMHSTPLLRAVGQQSKPILLKRGWSATLKEFLLAAEYVMVEGNRHVILCERGIRTHERFVRNTLALAIVPEVKRISSLPIIVDPSHGTGRSHLVAPMSNAAVACGADGLLIEVHNAPDRAWSDGDQSLGLAQFRALMSGLQAFAAASDRDL